MQIDVTTCAAQQRATKERTGGDYRYARAHAADDDETLSVLPFEQRPLVWDSARVRSMRQCVPLARRAKRVVSRSGDDPASADNNPPCRRKLYAMVWAVAWSGASDSSPFQTGLQRFFAPMHFLDRRLRPEWWEPISTGHFPDSAGATVAPNDLETMSRTARSP
jgi:hypothetical protein